MERALGQRDQSQLVARFGAYRMRPKRTKHLHYAYSRDETGRGIRGFKRPRRTSRASGWHAEPLACYPRLPDRCQCVLMLKHRRQGDGSHWGWPGPGQCALPGPELRRRGRVIIVHAPARGRGSTLSVRRRGAATCRGRTAAPAGKLWPRRHRRPAGRAPAGQHRAVITHVWQRPSRR